MSWCLNLKILDIRAIKDAEGILFLIGNATVDEYQAALRTIKYNYSIAKNSYGEPVGILSGPRSIYINVSDGQAVSLTSERRVDIQAKIELDIPNAFTPNGDNVNDTWRIQLLNRDKLVQAFIKVYNKRGLLIFEADGFERIGMLHLTVNACLLTHIITQSSLSFHTHEKASMVS